MANHITTFRLLLLLAVIALTYWAQPAWQLLNVPLLGVIFVLDAVDGWVARVRNEESLFGAIYDIAADRVVENVLWIVLAHLQLVPIWVALVFITRGILVDAVRSVGASQGRTPFSLSITRIGHELVGGRAMRFTYAALKAVAFVWIFLMLPLPALDPQLWERWGDTLRGVTDALIYSTVFLCVLRALPVLLEFGLRGEGKLLTPRPRRRSTDW